MQACNKLQIIDNQKRAKEDDLETCEATPLLNSSATSRLNDMHPPSDPNTVKAFKFDYLFFKHLLQVSRRLWRANSVVTILIFLLLLKLLEEYIVYQVGIITSLYYKILAERNVSGFLRHSLNSVLFILLVSFIKSTGQYVCSVLQVTCRHQLTCHLHRLYFRKNNFYKINFRQKDIDNPDQRITQDVDKFSSVLGTIIPVLVISPFTIGYYTYAAYSTTDWIGPVGVFAYFVVGTIINKCLMSPIVDVVYQQEKCEGHFRYKHVQVRVHSESIAFQDGAAVEHEYSDIKLKNLIQIMYKLFLKQYPLNLSVNCFNYLGSIVSFFILAIPIFSGRYDSLSPGDLSALISKNAFVTIYLISCFSNLVSLSDDFVTLAGTTHRIAQLEKSLLQLTSDDSDSPEDRKDSQCATDDDEQQEDFADQDPLISIRNLTYCTPDGKQELISNLSLQIHAGTNFLIVGNSGCGKTALLRILKGLWKTSSGDVSIRIPRDVFFVPQQSLLTDGTLRQQIIYPYYTGHKSMTEHDDRRLIQYLQLADMMHVYDRAGGLDSPVHWNWYDVLSPGEVQRLCFVRMLYHRPVIALLDEAVSAIGIDMEEKLYNKCKDLRITVVSVGHRRSLTSHHNMQLTFGDSGSWHLEKLPE